jgi:hypothetical protein
MAIGRSPVGSAQSPLKDPPHKVRQQREQQKHEYSAHPDQKVQRHLGRIDIFFVHAKTLAYFPEPLLSDTLPSIYDQGPPLLFLCRNLLCRTFIRRNFAGRFAALADTR